MIETTDADRLAINDFDPLFCIMNLSLNSSHLLHTEDRFRNYMCKVSKRVNIKSRHIVKTTHAVRPI